MHWYGKSQLWIPVTQSDLHTVESGGGRCNSTPYSQDQHPKEARAHPGSRQGWAGGHSGPDRWNSTTSSWLSTSQFRTQLFSPGPYPSQLTRFWSLPLRLKSKTLEPCTPGALDLHKSEPRDMKARVNTKMWRNTEFEGFTSAKTMKGPVKWGGGYEMGGVDRGPSWIARHGLPPYAMEPLFCVG